MPLKAFKRSLQEGQVQLGLWVNLADPCAAELRASTGYDWLLDPDAQTLLSPMGESSERAVGAAGGAGSLARVAVSSGPRGQRLLIDLSIVKIVDEGSARTR